MQRRARITEQAEDGAEHDMGEQYEEETGGFDARFDTEDEISSSSDTD